MLWVGNSDSKIWSSKEHQSRKIIGLMHFWSMRLLFGLSMKSGREYVNRHSINVLQIPSEVARMNRSIAVAYMYIKHSTCRKYSSITVASRSIFIIFRCSKNTLMGLKATTSNTQHLGVIFFSQRGVCNEF